MQASNKWLLLADPEAGTLVSLLRQFLSSSYSVHAAVRKLLACIFGQLRHGRQRSPEQQLHK